MEINSNEYFSCDILFWEWNRRPRGLAWKRHCTINKKNVFEFRVISTNYYGLSNDYRCKFSFIHHLLRLMMSSSFFKKSFRHNVSAFLVRCAVVPAWFSLVWRVSLVARMVNTNLEAQKLRLRQHRPFISIKSFEQAQQVGTSDKIRCPFAG